MANKKNHRREGSGNVKRTETGPRYENPNPGAGCNSTHVAKGRKKYKARRNRSERRSPISELDDLLGDAVCVFGLEAQGHVPTIQRMLADGETWDAIGKAIGWDPATAEQHWAWRTEGVEE